METLDIIADSAEPKSIAELRAAGLKVEPAQKGADSIRAGIQALQRYRLNVTRRSTPLIKELQSYKWRVDASGNTLNTPTDTPRRTPPPQLPSDYPQPRTPPRSPQLRPNAKICAAMRPDASQTPTRPSPAPYLCTVIRRHPRP